jgi:hypothetical protein
MGLLDGVLGNASKIDAAKIQQEFSQTVLADHVLGNRPK